jgi:Xaa-Pro aminopeptidase
MITMQPTLKNGRNVWDGINMPISEFQERLRELKIKMDREGLDALFIYAYAYDEYGNTAYLSNFLVDLARGDMVAVTKQGDVTLFFEGSPRGLLSAKTTTWVEDVRACPDISRECVIYLKEKGLLTSRIGFAGVTQLMPCQQLTFLTHALQNATIIEAGHIIEEMRAIKSIRERDQIQRAARIVKQVFASFQSRVFPDMNEKSVEALIFREARLEGAEDVRVLFGKPRKENWVLAPSDHGIIESEETVIVYLSVEFERYWAEGIRTFIAKDATFVNPDVSSLSATYERMTACLQSGKTGADCYREILHQWKKDGVEGLLDYGLGEGIGLGTSEMPFINDETSRLLVAGMCFSLRLALKHRDYGALMIGDTFCLSEKGLDILTG